MLALLLISLFRAFGVLARGSGVFSLVVGFHLPLLLSGVFEVLIWGKV
jgi:hypothetical protein